MPPLQASDGATAIPTVDYVIPFANYIIGGIGNDTIDGDLGNDVVIGGAGIDIIDLRPSGDVGNDLVITGQTVFDGSKAAVDAILAVWGVQTGGVSAAMSALTSAAGVGTVPVLGKVNLLVTNARTTVTDDLVADLFGDTNGTDWIFFQGDSGAGDENGPAGPAVLPTGFEFGTELK